MSSFVIACPNPACAKPLNLPAAAVGQPLTCPHCGTGIAVSLGPDGKPTTPVALRTGRVPNSLLVPGFALLMLGMAGVFANSYIASAALFEPGGDVKVARLFVDYMRDADAMGNPDKQGKKKGNEDAREAFAAVLGSTTGVAAQEEIDRRRAEEAAWWVGPFHAAFALVSLVMAAGGLAILLGRWYWLAMLGSVLAIFNISLCCCVPGLVAGLWGFLMLARDEGRRHFIR